MIWQHKTQARFNKIEFEVKKLEKIILLAVKEGAAERSRAEALALAILLLT